MTIAELRIKRKELITQARAVHEKADTEKRSMTAEEQTQFDTLIAESDKVKQQIDNEERAELLKKEFEDLERTQGTKAGKPETDGADETRLGYFGSKEYREEFVKYLASGKQVLSSDTIRKSEERAMQMGIDISGGYMVTPVQMMTGILKGLDDLMFARKNGNVLPPLTSAQSLGMISLDSDPEDGDWTTELGTGGLDAGITFGKRALFPHPYAKRIKLSKTLIRYSSDVETIYRARIMYKANITEEKAFLLGDGNNKPLGIFVASDDGVPTSRDVSAGNTATAITFDGLMAAKYKLKSQYWANLRWMFHKDAMLQLVQIKNGDGQYMWRDSIAVGEPDRILGIPIDVSEYCPNTFTTGKYVGSLQDWSWYWIVDALDMQIQVLTELYAETNQNGIIFRKETDAMPMLAEAFVRVKLG